MAMAAFPHRIISEAAKRITASLEFRNGDTWHTWPSMMNSRRSLDHLVGERKQPCSHNDDGALTMSPFVLSTMANNSLCSASGTLNFAIVSSKSLQKASHSVSVILRCLWDSLMERPV